MMERQASALLAELRQTDDLEQASRAASAARANETPASTVWPRGLRGQNADR
ncbi:hypothetical protein [Burkholderia sp. Bp9143]|uniref:hypothetical protein n=1 Tax=Burkholderia sp. Bp9143 TaxID=2184574 RepID=UPI0021AB225E|nr:hypothetical protein [Burkholderia sp. Bp9143]